VLQEAAGVPDEELDASAVAIFRRGRVDAPLAGPVHIGVRHGRLEGLDRELDVVDVGRLLVVRDRQSCLSRRLIGVEITPWPVVLADVLVEEGE
jgi:hypothetical protein